MDLITTILACSLYTNNSIIHAMIQRGSQNKELAISAEGNPPKNFSNLNQAVSYANNELKQGHNINIGLMQIPSFWLKSTNSSVSELLAPCKNMVIATQILNHAMDQCAELQTQDSNINQQACALSIYNSGNPQAGLDYANDVLSYAKDHSFDQAFADAKAKNPKAYTDMGKVISPVKPAADKAKATVSANDQQTATN